MNGLWPGIIDQAVPAHAGTAAFMGQLINFSKNVAIPGGLLFIVSAARQPSMVRLPHL